MNAKKRTIAFYLLLVFISGAVVGVVGHNLYDARVKAAARVSPEQFREVYIEELRSTVELDGNQVATLHQILDRTREQYKELKRRHRPEVTAIHQAQVEAIRAILRPDQISNYEKFLQAREKQREQMKGKH